VLRRANWWDSPTNLRSVPVDPPNKSGIYFGPIPEPEIRWHGAVTRRSLWISDRLRLPRKTKLRRDVSQPSRPALKPDTASIYVTKGTAQIPLMAN